MSEFEHYDFKLQLNQLAMVFEAGRKAKGSAYANPHDPRTHHREHEIWDRGFNGDENWDDIKQEVEESL